MLRNHYAIHHAKNQQNSAQILLSENTFIQNMNTTSLLQSKLRQFNFRKYIMTSVVFSGFFRRFRRLTRRNSELDKDFG